MNPACECAGADPGGRRELWVYLVNLKSVFRIGLGNVIFLWQSRTSGEKKHLVLLISQKDYEHIKKYGIWDRDLELRNWNWVNGACVGWR